MTLALRQHHWWLGLCLLTAACAQEETFESTEFMTFEEFVAQAYLEPETGIYIVDGDTPASGLDGLRAIYDRMISGQGLAVHQHGNSDDIWRPEERKRLTFCVGHEFGTRHAAVVASVTAAARDWEQTIDVDFIHSIGQDATCGPLNTNVMFDIRPTSGATFLARAFFPATSRESRNIMIDNQAFAHPTIDLTELMRHELGHVLGFRHEHTRPEAGTCFEDKAIRPVTAYDPASIMHYPWCNGTATEWHLTPLDRTGAIAVYGPPARGYAFQANTGEMWTHAGPTGLGMKFGTSPAFAGGFLAFQANTGHLWVGTQSTGLGMMPGTSPSISTRGDVAFQANTSELWVGFQRTGLGMMAGTSPDIAALAGGGNVVAFQANTGELWVNNSRIGFGMMAGTSPSIAADSSGGYQFAFQANTGELWVGYASTGLGMMPGTSPSLAAVAPGVYRVAFQANTGILYVNDWSTGLGMAAGTSPTITSNGDVLFQANTGILWRVDGSGGQPLGAGMAWASSPSN